MAAGHLIARRSRQSARAWDAFAIRVGASFRSSYRASWAWQFESHRLFRMRRLELLWVTPDGERKVGQCAVGVGRRRRVFGDGIQLLPDFERHWPAALARIVEAVGDGEYVYGSDWSLEVPRDPALAGIPGVTVEHVARTSVQVVELARWPSFEAYRRAVSANVMRNVKKAERAYPTLRVRVRTGLRGLPGVLKATALRRELFRRKGVARSTVGMALRSLVRLATMRRYSELASLTTGTAALASYVGVHFGSHFCYLEGAADREGKGASWYLLMAMIERAFAQSAGRGRFIMGSDDGSQAGVEAWEGLRRSRRQSGATPVETSVVRFTYRTPATRDEKSGIVADGWAARALQSSPRSAVGRWKWICLLVRRIEMKFGNSIASLGLAALVLGGVAIGCDNRTPAQKAGDNVNDAAHNAADATRDAGHNAADATRDATHTAADNVRDATK